MRKRKNGFQRFPTYAWVILGAGLAKPSQANPTTGWRLWGLLVLGLGLLLCPAPAHERGEPSRTPPAPPSNPSELSLHTLLSVLFAPSTSIQDGDKFADAIVRSYTALTDTLRPKEAEEKRHFSDFFPLGGSPLNDAVSRVFVVHNVPSLTPEITDAVSRVFAVTNLAVSGDANRDGCVDDADLLLILFSFGESGTGVPDLNGDSAIDDADLLIVLFNFGEGCNRRGFATDAVSRTFVVENEIEE